MRNAVFAVVALALLTEPLLRAVDTKVLYDKKFDFKQIRSWTWSPKGAGEVKMLVTAQDDPEAVRKRFEPVVMEAVTTQLTGRGYTKAGADADIRVIYYVLISAGTAAQSMGQFLPGTLEWGLPLFTPQTTALSVIEQGSLVIDLASIKLDEVIWRGVASAEVNRQMTEEKRDARVRDAIKSLIGKLPKRS